MVEQHLRKKSSEIRAHINLPSEEPHPSAHKAFLISTTCKEYMAPANICEYILIFLDLILWQGESCNQKFKSICKIYERYGSAFA
jgi:hypothetical protein